MQEGELIEGITEEVAENLLELQKRCIECGSTLYLQIHHRIFRSEGESHIKEFLEKQKFVYEKAYGKPLIPWTLHQIQNLCVLCVECHEGRGVGVHGGNEKLRQELKNSFTCHITGFNVKYSKIKSLY